MIFPLPEAHIEYLTGDGKKQWVYSVLPVIAEATFQVIIGAAVEPSLLLPFLGPATGFAVSKRQYFDMGPKQ